MAKYTARTGTTNPKSRTTKQISAEINDQAKFSSRLESCMRANCYTLKHVTGDTRGVKYHI